MIPLRRTRRCFHDHASEKAVHPFRIAAVIVFRLLFGDGETLPTWGNKGE